MLVHIPLFHIEAGLRSFNKKMPEEINRVLTDHVSSLLFAPTSTAVSNLRNEGIQAYVYQVGDVMYDAFLQNMKKAEEIHKLEHIDLLEKPYYLVTIHRAGSLTVEGDICIIASIVSGGSFIDPPENR